MKSPIEELQARGFIAQLTDPELSTIFAKDRTTAYIGFDPTADSLHLGHLIPILMLAHIQRHGHPVIALVGGATGMIGDPSGKSDERNLLTPEQVARNVVGLKGQLSHFLEFEGPDAAILIDNNDWISPMSFVDWLRDVGKYFTVNYMIAKESVKARMASEQGISYTEFSYMTMQAYDFLHLFREHGCTVQAGGNDQWGNITAGIELVRRVLGRQVYGLTCPLLSTSTGEKFGKSAGNAVWLDPNRTSPYAFYQYWMQTTDEDVERFLKLFTFLPLDEIEAISSAHSEAPHRRTGQQTLAAEMTRTVHGEEGLSKAQRASEILFGQEIQELEDAELIEIFADVPSVEVSRGNLEAGVQLTELFAATALTKSKGEARRLVDGGGGHLNNVRVDDPDRVVGPQDLASDSVLVLRAGKKRYALVRIV